jgi:tetratricopeptide (TPR) repeat protein
VSRRIFSILVFMLVYSHMVTGQQIKSHLAEGSPLRAHFAAAQQAQLNNDYATAEREYSAAITLAPDFAEAHMNLGLVYQLQHRNPEAMMEFARALKIKPALSGANFFLGVDYCNSGDGAKAVPYLKAAVRAEPGRVDPWSWLATALELSGNFQAELATVNRALVAHPADMDLLYQLGHVYERLGKQEVDSLGKMVPNSFRAEQLLAESYASSNEWPSAVIHFENALAASPNHPGLHVELGEVFLQAGKLKRAAGEFDDELAADRHSLRAILRRGEVKLIQGDIDGSLADWSRVISEDQPQAERALGMREAEFADSAVTQLPAALQSKISQSIPELQSRTGPAANFALAFVSSQSSDSSQAPLHTTPADPIDMIAMPESGCSTSIVRGKLEREQFSAIKACAHRVLTPASSASFRIQVAAALLQSGEPDAALTALSGLPRAVQPTPEASYWFARCYERLATATYIRLYKSDSNSYRAHQLKGDLDAAKEEDKEAMAEYRAAIELKPNLPNLHYSLGHLLWKHLQTAEAQRELEAELALNPNHAGAITDLGGTYLLDQQPDKALMYLTHALALDAESPEIHRDLGSAYSELGDYRKASVELSIALPSDRDGSIHFKLGRAYQALGEKEKAKRNFELSGILNRESHTKVEKQTERLAEMEK